MVSGVNKSDDEIIEILEYYVPDKWHNLNNWDIILSRAEWVDDNLVLFKCSFLDLYFDKDMVIQNYDNVVVYDDRVYYNIMETNGFEDYAGELFLNYVFVGLMAL